MPSPTVEDKLAKALGKAIHCCLNGRVQSTKYGVNCVCIEFLYKSLLKRKNTLNQNLYDDIHSISDNKAYILPSIDKIEITSCLN